MWLTVLLFFFISTVTARSCPKSYTSGGDGSCYRWDFKYTKNRDQTYKECGFGGEHEVDGSGYIPGISNAFQNSDIANKARTVDFIWLGMTCLNSSVTSCQWDTGALVTTTSYNNFDLNQPAPENGPCVVMTVSTGKWKSADCFNFKANYGCKFTPNVTVPYCHPSYYNFRGKCYTLNEIINGNRLNCLEQDSNFKPASIHSTGENAFFHSLAQAYHYEYTKTNQLYLGILQNGTWSDGTAVDYSNYASESSSQADSCISMSIDNNTSAEWLNTPCDPKQIPNTSYGIAVCSSDAPQPVPLATESPLFCTVRQNYSGTGGIKSPGYPRGSEANHCEWLITEDVGKTAELKIFELLLDEESTIKLYSAEDDVTPFKTVTSMTLDRTFRSKTNVLKIVYDTPGGESYWTGDFSDT